MSYKRHQNNDQVQGAMDNNQNRQNCRNQKCKNTTVIKNSGNSHVFVEAEASAKAFAKAFKIALNDQEDDLVSGEMDEKENDDDCDCKWDSHY